jgi:hypothetical protein
MGMLWDIKSPTNRNKWGVSKIGKLVMLIAKLGVFFDFNYNLIFCYVVWFYFCADKVFSCDFFGILHPLFLLGVFI